MSEINKTYSHYEVLAGTVEVPIEDGTVTSALIKCQQISTVTLNEEALKMLKQDYMSRLSVINNQLSEIAKVKP